MSQVLRLSLSLLVTTGLSVLAHRFLYLRLVRDLNPSARWRAFGAGLFGVLALALPLVRVLGHLVRLEPLRPIALAVWGWAGAAIYLILMFSLVEVVGRIRLQLRKARTRPALEGPSAADETRRLFLARTLAATAFATSGGIVSYGAWRAFEPPAVTELGVRLARLPKALDGLTLVQLSDLHIGDTLQRRFLRETIERANQQRPDLVVITGDLVDGSVPLLGSIVSELRGLKSRFGTYFVTGNHDYYSGEAEWAEALSRMGIHVLRNRTMTLGELKASFDLVGVDDWGARHLGRPGYDLEAALVGRDPERAAVLLAHQPMNFEAAVARGMGLQLSGHTHGGQMLPLTLLAPALWRYPAGHYVSGPGHLYVSRGTGFWGPPMRVGSPPEIVRVTLGA